MKHLKKEYVQMLYTYSTLLNFNLIDTDFDAVERLIREVYVQNKITPTQYPLLMSEPSIHNKEQRQTICEIIFEKLQLPAFFVCKAAVLSCFASGRSTSLILDSGASSTYTVPVHDGYALQKCNIIYLIEFLY